MKQRKCVKKGFISMHVAPNFFKRKRYIFLINKNLKKYLKNHSNDELLFLKTKFLYNFFS